MPPNCPQEWISVLIFLNLSHWNRCNVVWCRLDCISLCRRDFEAQVRPRSGLAIKKGITVLNSPGTIDADYRGEVCVILVNLSSEAFVIEDGERIAQMVIAKHEQPVWQEVEVLDETERGAGGFGHTGV